MRLLTVSLAGAILAMCMCSADLKKAEGANLKQVKDYVNSPMGRYSSWFSGVFYAGTDNEFDYVAIKHGSNTVKIFKIRKGELGIKRQIKVNADQAKWVNVTGMFPPSQ